MNETFVNIIAWGASISSSLLLLLRIYGTISDTDIDRVRALLDGYTYSYPLTYPAIISFISWAWIFSH